MVTKEERAEAERLWEYLLKILWGTADLDVADMPAVYNRQAYALFTMIKLSLSERSKTIGISPNHQLLLSLAEWGCESAENARTDQKVVGGNADQFLDRIYTDFVATVRRAVEDGRVWHTGDGQALLGFLLLPKWFVAAYSIGS